MVSSSLNNLSLVDEQGPQNKALLGLLSEGLTFFLSTKPLNCSIQLKYNYHWNTIITVSVNPHSWSIKSSPKQIRVIKRTPYDNFLEMYTYFSNGSKLIFMQNYLYWSLLQVYLRTIVTIGNSSEVTINVMDERYYHKWYKRPIIFQR